MPDALLLIQLIRDAADDRQLERAQQVRAAAPIVVEVDETGCGDVVYEAPVADPGASQDMQGTGEGTADGAAPQTGAPTVALGPTDASSAPSVRV